MVKNSLTDSMFAEYETKNLEGKIEIVSVWRFYSNNQTASRPTAFIWIGNSSTLEK